MRLLAVLAILGLVAAPALAERDMSKVYPMTVADPGMRTLPDYSNMYMAGSAWTTTATGVIVAEDDFDGVAPDGPGDQAGRHWVESIKFVGGVSGPLQVIWFTFYDAAHGYVDYVGGQFPFGGNYIWTLNISDPHGAEAEEDGYFQMWAAAGYGTTATWFMDTNGPTLGTTAANPPNLGFPGHPPLNYKFEINFIPEPSTLVLLGMGALALIRRR